MLLHVTGGASEIDTSVREILDLHFPYVCPYNGSHEHFVVAAFAGHAGLHRRFDRYGREQALRGSGYDSQGRCQGEGCVVRGLLRVCPSTQQ